MTPQQLRARIRSLRETVPITSQFERVLRRRGTWGIKPVWYTSQKEHWLGWLKGYKGAGYYNRKNWHRSTEFVYNHINCPPMVLWLGEASGVPRAKIAAAKRVALSAKPSLPTLCAAVRRIIPWQMIEDRLDRHGKHGKESGTHPEPNNETVKKRKLRASGRTPVQKAWRDDRQKAMKIMKEIFPSQQDYDLVLNQLSDSIQKGKSVAPKAWAVTLFPDGFRLNVGQVEVLTAFQDEIRLLVQGADRSIDTKLLKQSPYKVSGDNYIFSGRMEQFRRYRRALISPHHDFVIAAGTTQTGKPRAGTPHRASHSSGLADLAEAVAPMGVEKTRRIHWVESNELDDLGHGVQFLHDDLQSRYPVAFLEGYDWSHGGSATVRLLGICPPSITADHWSEIIKSAREAVVAFLSQEGNVNWGFRHEQVYVSANA